jgi:hypothetical protein
MFGSPLTIAIQSRVFCEQCWIVNSLTSAVAPGAVTTGPKRNDVPGATLVGAGTPAAVP